MVIISVVKNLMIRVGADSSGMRRELDKAQKNLREFKSNMNSTLKGIGATLATLGIGAVIKDATKSAMQVEGSMQQINRTMGASAQAFVDWANNGANAYNLAKSDALKYGQVYSNLTSLFSKSTAETMTRTQDLLKATGVVASATGRDMTDVMERIRSGLLGNTEAIEDLGLYVNIAMIESTKAFQQFANGKSWDQLNFQTQQQIRYFAILEQAARRFGVEVSDNTSSRTAQFVAQLRNVQLALGQAFLPIWNAVLPALTRMATALATIMNVVAQFTRALFGGGDAAKDTQAQAKATTAQSSAVGGLADSYTEAGKAAKAASGSVASFDEVNNLSQSSGADSGGGGGAGGGGAGGGLDGGLVGDAAKATEAISAKVKAFADKVKTYFGIAKTAVQTFFNFITDNKELVIAAIAGVAAGMVAWLIATKWTAIITGITSALSALRLGFIAAWSAITGPIGLIVLGIAALVAAIVYFYQTNEKFRGVVDGIFKAIGEAAKWLWNEVLVPFGIWLGTVFVAAWDAITIAAGWFLKNVLVPLGNELDWFWQNVLKPVGKFVADVFVAAWDDLKVAGEKVKEAFSLLGDKLIAIKDGAIEWATEKIDTFTKSLKDNETAIKAVGITLGVIFGPALIKTGIQAVATGLQITTSFIASLIASGVAAVTNAALVTANFIASMIKASAQAVLTGVAITASFIASMIKAGAQAVVTAVAITGQLIVAMVKYALEGWKTVAVITAQTVAWVASKVAVIAGTTVLVAMTIATTAQSVATGVLTAAQWALNVALNANPIGVVIIAITALGAAVYAIIKYWDNITSAIKTAWEWLTKWNGTKADDKTVTVTEVRPPGGKYITQPITVPKLARGGIVDGAANMGNYIAGEAGKEMIVPLENTSFVDKLASALGTAVMTSMQMMTQGGSQQSSGDVKIQIDGTTLARVLHPYLDKENGRIGKGIISTT